MGQTQLLMIVLAVIIIGIAVTVGITQFGESAATANQDALSADCSTAINKAQGWFRKPTSLGGGGNSFTGLTLAKLGMNATNANGTIALTATSATVITALCTSASETQMADAAKKIFVQMVYTSTTDAIVFTSVM